MSVHVIYEDLCELFGQTQVKTAEPMEKHTTFRIGGPASYFVMPKTPGQIADVISLCGNYEIPYVILGNGSNLLVSDAGFLGVVIAMEQHWNSVEWQGNRVIAGAGALLGNIARQALERSLTGMEFAAFIPGTIGGAVVMNAGAYGSEMKDILIQATVLTKDGQIRDIPAEELQLGYRTSCILSESYVVLEAVLELKAGEEQRIRTRMEELGRERRLKQPLEYPSAGSTFKRPEGYFAGKLIQDVGLKGYRIGGAQVSEKHSGFVVNRGGATAADVCKLCRHVQKKVKQETGITLELEVKLLGEC